MTVSELKDLLQKMENQGFGDIDIALPLDDYNTWVEHISKLQYRLSINSIVICPAHVECSGVDFDLDGNVIHQ